MYVNKDGITVETSAADLPTWLRNGYAEVKPIEAAPDVIEEVTPEAEAEADAGEDSEPIEEAVEEEPAEPQKKNK